MTPPRESRANLTAAAEANTTLHLTFFPFALQVTLASRPGGPGGPVGPATPAGPGGPPGPFAPVTPGGPCGKSPAVPASETVVGDGMLPDTVIVAEREPCAPGAKRTPISQDAPTAI